MLAKFNKLVQKYARMVAESLDSKDKNRRHRLPITPPLAKFNKLVQKYARMVELVDTRDLKSLGLNSCAGSSPALRTKYGFFGIVA